MAYPTICDECLAGDHEQCGESELTPIVEQSQQWNEEHPEDHLVGGGFCVCRHGEPEGAWEQSVREQLKLKRDA